MSEEKVADSYVGYLANLPVQDSSFTEVFLSLRNLGVFYGTDNKGQHDSYLFSIQKALETRIEQPIVKWCEDPHTCFFKPYSGKKEGLSAFINGFFNPLWVVVCGLGLVGAAAANPVSLLTQFCTPSIIELIVGIVGLAQALWYQMKSWYYQSEADYDEATTYFLDAVTRFALIIPLAVVTLISGPLDFVRYITRCIATLIDVTISEDVKEENTVPDYVDTAVEMVINFMC